jgi:hypothetical protein
VSKLIILALQIELASLTMRASLIDDEGRDIFGQGGFFCQEREGILNEGKDKIIFFII